MCGETAREGNEKVGDPEKQEAALLDVWPYRYINVPSQLSEKDGNIFQTNGLSFSCFRINNVIIFKV